MSPSHTTPAWPGGGATSWVTSSGRRDGNRAPRLVRRHPRHPPPRKSSRKRVISAMDWRMDVKEVLLPGVGLRYEFDIRDGNRVGVVARRSGNFELVVYGRDDPDEARPVFRLTEDEAETLAQILGAPRIAESFANLTREVPGLNAGQAEIHAGTPFVDRPLGDTRARTRTGAS